MMPHQNSRRNSKRRSQSKEVLVQFDEKTYRDFCTLETANLQNPSGKQLIRSINTVIDKLIANPYYGDLIPRRNIPGKVVEKYGTNQLFRVELTGYWRLIYTLRGNEATIIALILDYMSHKGYDKLFGYKKK